MFRFIALMLAFPLAAQVPAGRWTLGVFSGTPEFTGEYSDSGERRTYFDLQKDFNLKKDKESLGVHMAYSGPRFGFSMEYEYNNYSGQNRIGRVIELGGQSFPPYGLDIEIDVASSLKNTVFDLNWTIKVLRRDQAWLGADLGIQAWYLDIEAKTILDFLPPQYQATTIEANEMYTVAIPQFGVSGGYQGLQDRLVLGCKAHFFAYKGAKYSRFAADARYYFFPWLGARVFGEIQSLDAPDGSIYKNVEVNADRKGLGFGVVVRW